MPQAITDKALLDKATAHMAQLHARSKKKWLSMEEMVARAADRENYKALDKQPYPSVSLDGAAIAHDWHLMRRNWQMPGDGRYQPDELKPYLGYDQWASWLVIVEWFWFKALAQMGEMPAEEAALLKDETLFAMLEHITTTEQDYIEKGDKAKGIKGTGHDILALVQQMRQYLPKPLHKWTHWCPTSYDPIITAYALQLRQVFLNVVWPKMLAVDKIWRDLISANAQVVQAGRTHLQTALPVTVGFWLAVLHQRFIDTSLSAKERALLVPGKFSGAVGTYASQKALINHPDPESVILDMLGLPAARLSTQIAPPENVSRFYHEFVLLTGALGNLGEDVRILQSSTIGELVSVSSTSSTMAHKAANPIAAENNCGMHVNVLAEYQRVLLTLVSDLQRDLRWSSVMRGFTSIIVYSYQQLLTTERLLKSIAVNEERCHKNFEIEARLVMGELLHLAMQRTDCPGTHTLVNTTIVPAARASGRNLLGEMETYVVAAHDQVLRQAWASVSDDVKRLLIEPEKYTGKAVEIAQAEAQHALA